MLQMRTERRHSPGLSSLQFTAVGKWRREEVIRAAPFIPAPQAHNIDSSGTIQADAFKVRAIGSVHATTTIEDRETRFFWQIEVAGKTFVALVDPGSQKSYAGTGPATLLKNSILPSTSYMRLPNGQLCPTEGCLNLSVEIDEVAYSGNFQVSRTLEYDFIFGMDLLLQTKIKIDLETKEWISRKKIRRAFHQPNAPCAQAIQATAAIEGVATLSYTEKTRLQHLLNRWLPPKCDKLPLA